MRVRAIIRSAGGAAVVGGAVVACSSFAGSSGTSSTDGGPSDAAATADAAAPVDAASDAPSADGGGYVELAGLIGYWPFDETAGSTAHDLSGKQNNGAVTGATWVAGVRGNALHADGSNTQHVEMHSFDGHFPTSGTISLWFKADTFDGIWILDTYDATRNHLYLDVNKGDNPASFEALLQGPNPKGGNTSVGFATVPATLSTWTHVVLVWDADVAHDYSLYTDGALRHASTLDPAWKPTDQHFWLFPYGCCGGFQGTIDEVRLYDRAVTAAEALAIP